MRKILIALLLFGVLSVGRGDCAVLIGFGPSTPASPVFVEDSFTNTGGSDIELSTHTGETGATWTKNASSIELYNSYSTDDVYMPNGAAEGSDGAYFASGSATGSEYDVEMDIQYKGDFRGGQAFMLVRSNGSNTWYYLGHRDGVTFLIAKLVNNVFTQLATYDQTLDKNVWVKLKADVRTSSPRLRLLADTGSGYVEKCVSDDTAISYASGEKVGLLIYYPNAGLSADIPRIDNFKATRK